MKVDLFETLQDFKDWKRKMLVERCDTKSLIDDIQEPKKFPVIMVWYYQRWDEDNEEGYNWKYIYKDSFDTIKRFSFKYHNPFNILVK